VSTLKKNQTCKTYDMSLVNSIITSFHYTRIIIKIDNLRGVICKTKQTTYS